MKFKNNCKFGLFVKDLNRVIGIGEIIDCDNTSNITELLKEHKLIKQEDTKTSYIPKIINDDHEKIEEIKPKKKGKKKKKSRYDSEGYDKEGHTFDEFGSKVDENGDPVLD